jgi:phospholipase C
MAEPTRDRALDHVVVVMFENRSFDNVLGRLYQPGEVSSFEGVLGEELSNPIPEWAEHGADRKAVPYGVAASMDAPNPDPGEEYTHVNTQLFGVIDPAGNRGVMSEQMVAPYNAPAPGQQPTMDGFVADYISAFTAQMGRQPTYDEYAQIMTGYTPEQVPVLSGLARGFATFDHWFCEVPSQTFTNRSFFHAGSASGFVVNSFPTDAFPVRNTAETLFQRLEANGLTWRVYCDNASVVPFTGMIHASQLRDRFANFHTMDQFLEDAEQGRLPTYSFIEPNLLHGHNDMHPSFNAMFPGLALDAPSSLLGGEALLAQIYDAIRTSASPDGSNAYNTLLMVSFDEHGGTYDHVPPPPAPPPDPGAPRGQMEAVAPPLDPVILLDTPRAPEEWPDVVAQPVPGFDTKVVPPDAPLSGLGRALFLGLLALGKEIGQPVPDIAPDTVPTGREAVAIMLDLFGHMFPNLRGST